MLNAAEVMIHSLRDVENGLAMLDEALDLAEGDDEVADALLLKFDALMQQDDRSGAAAVAKNLPEGPFENEQLDFMVGRARFESGDLDGAERHLNRAKEQEGASGEAHYYYGLVREARGDGRGATLSFLRAREADLQAPRPPWTLPVSGFERRVQNAVRRLPAELGQAIENCLVVVSDMPGPEVVAEGVDPHIGVLIDDVQDAEGKPVGQGGSPTRAGRVFVYQRNIERFTANAAEVEEEILRALEHELTLTFAPPAEAPPPLEN
jgi:tetratricopeptide (TPR) repeat protein